jgi:hypothetical protein
LSTFFNHLHGLKEGGADRVNRLDLFRLDVDQIILVIKLLAH